ncbi:MAG: hypothetical protein C4539_12770 [Ignavibacteriales bacterium]|nr:MAG: hypothetical protein C4539_12770 [Ignavibacteriales bacterium]
MKKILLGLSLSFLVLLGCKDDMETVSNPDNTSSISLSISNLPKISDQLTYEGWLVFDDAGTSYKKVISFQPGTDGKYSNTFTVPLYDLKRTKYFIVTLEPADEDSAAETKPSNLKVLGGVLVANDLTLGFKQVSDTLSIYNSIKNISGSFTLYSPTYTANTDSLIGVWFANYSNGVLSEGLSLAKVSGSWSYEGWVISGKYIFSTGTFSAASGKDASNDYSSTGTIPDFPGEDFIVLPDAQKDFNSADMQNAIVLVTINHPSESGFTPYVMRLPVLYGSAQSLNVKQTKAFDKLFPSELPSGTVKVNAKI